MRNFLVSEIFIFLNNANVHAETDELTTENTINGQKITLLDNVLTRPLPLHLQILK